MDRDGKKGLEKIRKFIVYASSQAQKATDFILNIRNDEKELEIDKNIDRKIELKNSRELKNGKLVDIER